MATSTSPSLPPITFRQYTTLTRADLPQGRIVEYIASPRASVVEPLPEAVKDSNTATKTYKSRPKPWASSTSNMLNVDRKKRLEKMNLRGDIRRGSRSSTTPKTNSSCKRSDSATNDSQRSALTSESLDEGRTPSCNDIYNVVKVRDTDASEVRGEDLTEDELEKRRNYEKCMSWIERLPAKFSGMHIAQERAPAMKD